MMMSGSLIPSRPAAMLQDLQASSDERRASEKAARKLARVINGKRMVQSATDIFVGWGSLDGRANYIRQFRDMKIIPTTKQIARRLAEFATARGGALARANARTGDPVAIDSYIGKDPTFLGAHGLPHCQSSLFVSYAQALRYLHLVGTQAAA